MPKTITKGELVLFALRKCAIASNATLTDVEPQSVADALDDLEAMMAEWRARYRYRLPVCRERTGRFP